MEDFVTYEIAVKLKEKGFREHVRGHYKSKYHLSVCSEPINCNCSASGDISAPQIHEVLKWLREEKKLHIRASVYFIGWCVDVTNMDGKRMYSTECEYHNYEQSILAGIEYVINNLI